MTKNHVKCLCYNRLVLKTIFYKILSIWRIGYFQIKKSYIWFCQKCVPYVFDKSLIVNIIHEVYLEYFLYLLDIREKEKREGG